MSAVRMVAYGVLELKPKVIDSVWSPSKETQQEDFERDQLRKLVNDELKRYGLLLTRMVVPKGSQWRTKLNTHVLYGQTQGMGFRARQVLHEGEFRDCCIKAAQLLDQLDASQVPDTATGCD